MVPFFVGAKQNHIQGLEQVCSMSGKAEGQNLMALADINKVKSVV
jgi:hypothetical protein